MKYTGDECYLWPYGKATEYGYPTLKVDGKVMGIHRYVCELFNGPPPTPNHAAAHSCGHGNIGCVTPHHLLWKTYSENETDKLIHGTHIRGTRNHSAKLTELDVYKIRDLQDAMPTKKIAQLFGVSERAIMFIHSRKNWAWLPEIDSTSR
jgi:hypothetical protein